MSSKKTYRLFWQDLLALIQKYLGSEKFRKLSELTQHLPLQSAPLWIASIITALCAVFYSMLFSWTERLHAGIIEERPWMVFILTPLNFLISWFVVAQFARPAAGSGIPQLMASVDLTESKKHSAVYQLLNFKVFIIKIVSSVIMVFGGGAIGREGPTLQLAGSIYYYTHRWLPDRWPKFSRKVMLITGGAAGLSAAFNTPLGGIVFVIEELTRTHITNFRTAVFTAVIIAGMTAQLILGPYLFLGYPPINVDGVRTIAWSGLMGLLIAPIGVYFTEVLYHIAKWKFNLPSKKDQILVSLGFGFAVALFIFFVGPESAGSGKELMIRILFEPTSETNIQTALSRIVTPVLSYANGSAGGIFAPALSTGAGLASFFSELLRVDPEYHNVLVLAGMCSFLTAVTGSPFTSAILVLEMTDRHSAIFHLMFAAMITHMIARLMQKESFYELLKKDYLSRYDITSGEREIKEVKKADGPAGR